jgi:hypothetical protein
MPWTYKEVEIEITLEDFETEELIEELENRGSGVNDFGDGKQLLETIYQKRRLGKDYQTELDQLIWRGLGKVI